MSDGAAVEKSVDVVMGTLGVGVNPKTGLNVLRFKAHN
jgi:hypothetical protein